MTLRPFIFYFFSDESTVGDGCIQNKHFVERIAHYYIQISVSLQVGSNLHFSERLPAHLLPVTPLYVFFFLFVYSSVVSNCLC